MTDTVNKDGVTVSQDTKGKWRGPDGSFAKAPNASATSAKPKASTKKSSAEKGPAKPKITSEPDKKPVTKVIVPPAKTDGRGGNRTGLAVLVIVLLAVALAAVLLWSRSGSVPNSGQQTTEQTVPPPAPTPVAEAPPAVPPAPISAPQKVADSRCTLAGTVYVNQIQRCVYPLK